MLAHSPQLPLVIAFPDELHHRDIAKDDEGIKLALQQRDRVRRVRVRMFEPTLSKFIKDLDREFPILEYLSLRPPDKVDTAFTLPENFEAPHLRHLVLNNFVFPASPFLRRVTSLATLSVMWIPPSTYFHPNEFLRLVSLCPQLEILRISFQSPVANHTVEQRLSNTPITTDVTLPYLRWISFLGASAYLEALLPRMATPSLEKLQIWFFNQLTYSVPNLRDFTITNENLRSNGAIIKFSTEAALVKMYPHEGDMIRALYMETFCRYLDWQVSSMVQICYELSPMFSLVEHLMLTYEKHNPASTGAMKSQAQNGANS
jgi:hypothetical protein